MKRFVLLLLMASCSRPSSVKDAGASVPQKLALEPLLAATPDGGSAKVSQEEDQYFKVTPLPPVGPPLPDDRQRVHDRFQRLEARRFSKIGSFFTLGPYLPAQ